MSKQMKKTIFGILGGIVLMLLIAYLPPETEMMSRQGWQYLGCFGFLLTCLISGALPDWVATLATMVMLLVFKLGKVADVTVEFSGTTVWLCIGVFIMSVGINNSGFMKRLALWVLTKFPGTYRGQVTAMMLAGIITTPMIPSSYAKTSIMAPLIGQVCEAVGAEPNSKAARGLWFANFMGTYILGIAFMSGSAFVALMIGFMQGLAFTWGSWLKCTIVWYLVLIVLTYLYCTIICKPKEKLAGDVTFLKEQYKALGAISKKEKQGIIIVAIAIILWITQKLHGVDAGFVAIAADVAFFAAGLLTAPEANAKGQWTLVVFIGGILSIAKFMNTTGVSAWLASLLGPIFAPIMSSPYIFVRSIHRSKSASIRSTPFSSAPAASTIASMSRRSRRSAARIIRSIPIIIKRPMHSMRALPRTSCRSSGTAIRCRSASAAFPTLSPTGCTDANGSGFTRRCSHRRSCA